MKILCSVATYKRYYTTLPLVLMAIANQTRLPDKLIIFDDNDEPEDLRNSAIFRSIFALFDEKKLPWEVVFAPRKGQHHIHQMANMMGYDWVWRVDDDCVPEPNVLQNLAKHTQAGIGAIGGSILTPPVPKWSINATGKISRINDEPHIQWGYIKQMQTVEHLHCSFLYRAGVYDYQLGLSRVAHREETLFTYGLYQNGYSLLVVPNSVSWHLKNPNGGIRAHKIDNFEHDERIFNNFMALKNKTIVVLNNGMGDHVVFSHVLPEIRNPVVFTCYPEIVPGQSIAEAIQLFGDIDQWNIYKKMHMWGWKDSLEKAFRKLYLR